jgi:hypothetical protein
LLGKRQEALASDRPGKAPRGGFHLPGDEPGDEPADRQPVSKPGRMRVQLLPSL